MLIILFSTGDGVNTGIENIQRQILQQPRCGLFRFSMLAQLKSSGGLLTVLDGLWRLIGPVSQGKQLPGL
jgi:hypothetical protein